MNWRIITFKNRITYFLMTTERSQNLIVYNIEFERSNLFYFLYKFKSLIYLSSTNRKLINMYSICKSKWSLLEDRNWRWIILFVNSSLINSVMFFSLSNFSTAYAVISIYISYISKLWLWLINTWITYYLFWKSKLRFLNK